MKNNVTNELILLYLNHEFSKLNIKLTEQQLNSFVSQITDDNNKSFKYELSREQLKYTKYACEEDTEKDVIKIISNFDNRIEDYINSTDEEKSEYMPDLAERLAKEKLGKIYKNRPDYIISSNMGKDKVKKEIKKIWSVPLNLLELLIETSINISKNYDVRKLEEYENNVNLFDALRRLQGRACLISNEILVLLREGFPDGAYARCRTLYETMIISSFLIDSKYGGNEVSKRYLDYSVVSDLNEARKIEKYNKTFNGSFSISKEIKKLENTVEQLKSVYGDDFVKSDYAWAYTLKKSNKHKVKFSEIEEVIDFKHMKSFYKSASNNIHSGASSLYFHRGLDERITDRILTGCSSYGIDEPLEKVVYFINIITINLLTCKIESLEKLLDASLLNQIRDDIIESIDIINNQFSNEIIDEKILKKLNKRR